MIYVPVNCYSPGGTTLADRRGCSAEVQKMDPIYVGLPWVSEFSKKILWSTCGLFTVTWVSFLRKKWPWNGTRILKFSQSFLILSKYFQKSYPTRDWFFYFVVFATLRGTGGGEKKVPWPAEPPRTPSCSSTPKFYHPEYQRLSFQRKYLLCERFNTRSCIKKPCLDRSHSLIDLWVIHGTYL